MKNIRKVVPYVAGEQPNKPDMVKLNTNECPYPPAPAVAEVIKNMDSEVKSMVIELIKELSIFYIKNLTHNDKENMSSFNKNFTSNLSDL